MPLHPPPGTAACPTVSTVCFGSPPLCVFSWTSSVLVDHGRKEAENQYGHPRVLQERRRLRRADEPAEAQRAGVDLGDRGDRHVYSRTSSPRIPAPPAVFHPSIPGE